MVVRVVCPQESVVNSNWRHPLIGAVLTVSTLLASGTQAQQQSAPSSGPPPNIVFIMGDDIGWFNLSAYHHGIMASRTPSLDKLVD